MTDKGASEVEDRTQTIGSMYLGVRTTLDRAIGLDDAAIETDEALIAEAFKQAGIAAGRVLAGHPHLLLETDV